MYIFSKHFRHIYNTPPTYTHTQYGKNKNTFIDAILILRWGHKIMIIFGGSLAPALGVVAPFWAWKQCYKDILLYMVKNCVKIYFSVLHSENNGTAWNDMRVSKQWQNFHFMVKIYIFFFIRRKINPILFVHFINPVCSFHSPLSRTPGMPAVWSVSKQTAVLS